MGLDCCKTNIVVNVNRALQTDLLVKRQLTRKALVKRGLVAVLSVYYFWILAFALSYDHFWFFSNWQLGWTSSGPGAFFPFPRLPGYLTALSYSGPLNTIFCIVFIANGIWILWVSLIVYYILSPYSVSCHRALSILKGRLRNIRQTGGTSDIPRRYSTDHDHEVPNS
ncbi:MAG: hypothetical protein ACXAEN_25270 [Candidatus Thorarchaeota archaeon]